MKAFSCVAHDAVFGLLENETVAGYSKYTLHRNASLLGVCEFPSHLAPKFSVASDGSFAAYGGCNAYFVTKDEQIACFEEQEEISRIWFLDDMILVEGDTLLASRSRSTLEIYKEYWHSEIITSGFLRTERIMVFQDLENGVYQLNVDDFSVVPSDYPFAVLV